MLKINTDQDPLTLFCKELPIDLKPDEMIRSMLTGQSWLKRSKDLHIMAQSHNSVAMCINLKSKTRIIN